MALNLDKNTAKKAVLSVCSRILGSFMGTAIGTLMYLLIGSKTISVAHAMSFFFVCAAILAGVEYTIYNIGKDK